MAPSPSLEDVVVSEAEEEELLAEVEATDMELGNVHVSMTTDMNGVAKGAKFLYRNAAPGKLAPLCAITVVVYMTR